MFLISHRYSAPIASITTRVFQMGHEKSQVGRFFPLPETLNQVPMQCRSTESCLDENEAFFTTADSAIGLLPESTKPIPGWNGIEYKAAFPMQKPAGASFYPPDMDKMVKFVHVYKWQSCKLLQVVRTRAEHGVPLVKY
ncbi:hypothetical protein L2E82_32889 [Cichorium intybus]|uniref:Uncharacterized protein n=2 Tax=Cichorium intybus TaxID=13427 RepID=A0ACB9BIJ9_CICIN|nr:hypothetical protein L2E82_32888 [Cichorium intybus]KAI3721870.1 hypothetical protein L2E82_32889 [Cichorium intybus]